MSNNQETSKFSGISSVAMRYLKYLDDSNKEMIQEDCDISIIDNRIEEPAYVTVDEANFTEGSLNVPYSLNNLNINKTFIYRQLEAVDSSDANHLTMFETQRNDFSIPNINEDLIRMPAPPREFAFIVSDPSFSSNELFTSPPKKRNRETSLDPSPESSNAIKRKYDKVTTQALFGDRPSPKETFEDISADDCSFKLYESINDIGNSYQETDDENYEQSAEINNSENLRQSDPFIDESLIPERCRNNFLEKTIMQHEKLTVDTSYSSRYIMKTNKNVIDDFYKVQKFENWDAISDDFATMAAKIMEPSLDYLHMKLNLPMKVHLGQREQEITVNEELNCENIHESLQEIEESFTSQIRFVASTPNRSLTEKQSRLPLQNLELSKTIAKLDEAIKSKSQLDLTSVSASNDETYCSIAEKSLVKPSAPLNKSPQKDQQESSAVDVQSFHFSQIDPNDFVFSFPDNNDLQVKQQPGNAGNVSEEDFRGFTNEEQQQANKVIKELQSQKASEAFEILSQQHPTVADARRSAILLQIEIIFHTLLESLVEQKPMVLKIRKIKTWSDCEMNTNDVLSQRESAITTKSISFNNKASERTFTITVAVMCEVYKMLARNLTCSKRELYYRDVELFRNQESVNKAVDTLCAMLNVQECELGVMSSSKGLIAGDLIINIGDERIDCKTSRAVPSNPSAITSFESNADYVLIVEKDTVFQRLVNDDIFNRINEKIILITAKGYPDVNTRTLLKKMATELKKPMYIIVDADPHGIEIMCTYKYGSLMKVHNSEHLAVPDIEWIGIHPTDIETLDVNHVELTPADLKKVDELLERPYTNHILRRELNSLKARRFKAEIENIYHYSIDYLINDYIPRKIRLVGMPAIP